MVLFIVIFIFYYYNKKLGRFYLCLMETLSLTFDTREKTWICEVCNSFCFWYNENTKRAERQLDSNVAR